MTIFDVKHELIFSRLEQWALTDTATIRLLLACALGGAIGLDREFHHKPSGVRTNLLICFGSALFTYLSPLIAGDLGSNKGQIAANIVQGVGFLGAGLILHNRNRISGLTSAATVFAVAAVGMACGAGLYLPAAMAAAMVLVTLEVVGAVELFSNLKLLSCVYEVRGQDAGRMELSVLEAMDRMGHRLDDMTRESLAGIERLSFTVMATRRGQLRLKDALVQGRGIDQVLSFRTWEEELRTMKERGGVIEFAKAHGCGNDFLIVDAAQVRGQEMAALAQVLCARTTGVGADGVEYLTLQSERAGAIRLYNADGSVAEISGNGTRCVAAWMAYRARLGAGAEVVLETDAGPRVCRLESVAGTSFHFATGMGVPQIAAMSVWLADGTEVAGAAIDMGNPQFVALADDDDFTVAGRPWQEAGAAICTYKSFPAGTNVEFVRRRGAEAIEIRIYERGVGPTSSSGTGTSASAAMMMALAGAPRRLRVLAPGGEQVVSWPVAASELMLRGPAVVLATGQWLGASAE